MKVPTLITDRQEAITALCQRTGVRRLDLFGSAVRSDFDPLHSDLDFVVVLDDQPAVDYSNAFFALKEGLEGLFQRPVDLVVERAIRNPFFRRRLEEERQAVYAG